MNRLGELLEAERAKRDLSLTEFAQSVLGIHYSLVSRYISGIQSPNRQTVRKIAAALQMTTTQVDALLAEEDAERRGKHKPGLGPTGAEFIDQIADAVAQRVMGQIGERIAAAPVAWAHAGPPVATARILELAGGAVKPVIVQDDSLAGVGVLPGSVAWIDPTATPTPGKIVRVGDDEPAKLKLYEDGDDARGVVVLVQYSPP